MHYNLTVHAKAAQLLKSLKNVALIQQPFKSALNLFSAVKVESLGRVRKTKACQGELLTMSCKDSLNTLIIFKASYAGDSEVCPYKPDKPLPFKQIFERKDNKDSVSCKEDVTDKIKKWCGWSKECRLTVNPAIGESCRPGANRYLSVAYSCGKLLN